jgi:predicted DNA-binding transcriptional regulator AlpA
MEKSVAEVGFRPVLDQLRSRTLINSEDMREKLGRISRSLLWRLLQEGRIPQPLRLSKKIVRWRLSEIDDWIAAGMPKMDVWEKSRAV